MILAASAILALSFCISSPAPAQDEGMNDGKVELTYTLDECIHMAYRQSPVILAAAAEMKRTRGVIWEAWASIISASADIGYNYMDPMPVTGGTIPAGAFGPGFPTTDVLLGPEPSHHYWSAKGEASIPIFTGGRVVNGIKVAYLQDDVAYEQYRMAVGDALYGVKTAFYGILLAEELVRVRTESLEVLERHHETTLAKYEVGLVSRFDVLRSEVELANARPPLIQAKNDLKIAQESLKRLLGVDVDDPFAIEGELTLRDVEVDLEESLALVMAQGPGMRVAEYTEEIARRNVRMSRGELLPTVTTFATYEWSQNEKNVNFHDWNNTNDWEFVGGVVVSVPLLDMAASIAELKQSRAEYEKALVGYLDTINAVKVDVKEAYYDLLEAREIVESQRLNIEVAEESLRIAEVRYDNGISTLVELLDTELALTQARLNYINALYNFEEAHARLLSILGTDTMEIE